MGFSGCLGCLLVGDWEYPSPARSIGIKTLAGVINYLTHMCVFFTLVLAVTGLMLGGHHFIVLFLESEKLYLQFFDRGAAIIHAPSPLSAAPTSPIRVARTVWNIEIPRCHPHKTEIVGDGIAESVRVAITPFHYGHLIPWPKPLIFDFWKWPREPFFKPIVLSPSYFSVRKFYREGLSYWYLFGQVFALNCSCEVGYHTVDAPDIYYMKSELLLRAVPCGHSIQGDNGGLSANQLLSHQFGLFDREPSSNNGTCGYDESETGIENQKNHGPVRGAVSFLLQPESSVIESVMLGLIGILVFRLGFYRNNEWLCIFGGGMIFLATVTFVINVARFIIAHI